MKFSCSAAWWSGCSIDLLWAGPARADHDWIRLQGLFLPHETVIIVQRCGRQIGGVVDCVTELWRVLCAILTLLRGRLSSDTDAVKTFFVCVCVCCKQSVQEHPFMNGITKMGVCVMITPRPSILKTGVVFSQVVFLLFIITKSGPKNMQVSVFSPCGDNGYGRCVFSPCGDNGYGRCVFSPCGDNGYGCYQSEQCWSCF